MSWYAVLVTTLLLLAVAVWLPGLLELRASRRQRGPGGPGAGGAQ